MVCRIDEADWDGPHVDDDGEPCNCTAQECGKNGSCPECGQTHEAEPGIALVHGDHGCRCNNCEATFICP